MILNNKFYNQSTESIAKQLLGCYLVSELSGGKVIGKIVETEAYLVNDPASHSYKGQTSRNKVMFGAAGHLYVYLIYGLYYCINVVTGKKNQAEAVLIRALEPIKGIELMKVRRKTDNLNNLTNGPARLTQSLAINLDYNGHYLTQSPIYILSANHFGKVDKYTIISSSRIGITKATNLKLRFYIKDNKFVSK